MGSVSHDRPQWSEMRRQDIHADEPLTLFDAADVAGNTAAIPVKPDRYGTPDMFSDAES